MPCKSNVTIRLTTSGDVVLDQLISAIENPRSPAATYIQTFQPNVSTVVFNPFITFGGDPAYANTGMLIVPARYNGGQWTLSTLPNPPALLFHPTNPMFITLISLGSPLYLWHNNGVQVTFQFFWI